MDSLASQIAVINHQGEIVQVNRAWVDFGRKNNKPGTVKSWIGTNYFNACIDDKNVKRNVLPNIKKVLIGSLKEYSLEYPCDSPKEKRWFLMSVTPLDKIPSAIVIAHINIAQRKLAELALNQAQLDLKKKNRVLEDLSFIDSLTQIPNRRHFEQFLDAEWEKSVWSKKPISVAMVDIDFFKKYNDQFGHPAGDECLKKVAKEIRDSLHRPSVLS